MTAARGTLQPHLRDIVSQHIGPNSPIKSMEEFEALRFMKAENLRPGSGQVEAINAIRQAIGIPPVGTDLVKVVDLDTAMIKLAGGDPNLTGFFLTKTDLGPVTTTEEMIGAVRLDYPGSPFSAGTPHVVMETKMSSSLAAEARIPRDGMYLDGSPIEYPVPAGSKGYPNTGNGITASVDGRLRPESIMRTGAPMDANVTVMKFKNPDGTPKVVTTGGQSASDWVLKQIEPGNPQAGYRWDPLP